MSTRRSRAAEHVNALLASLFLIVLGLATGLIAGVGYARQEVRQEADAGYLSLDGRAYRVTPMQFTEAQAP